MTGPQTVLFLYFVAMTIFEARDVWKKITTSSLDPMTRRPEYIGNIYRAFAHSVAAIAIGCWN